MSENGETDYNTWKGANSVLAAQFVIAFQDLRHSKYFHHLRFKLAYVYISEVCLCLCGPSQLASLSTVVVLSRHVYFLLFCF